VDGLKTGHTEAAGYCLIATARREVASLGSPSAAAGAPGSTGSRRLLAVVLGTASEAARANEAQKLLNWGFTAFDAVKLFEAGQPVQTAPIWKGRSAHVKLGRPQPIVVAVPAGSVAKLQTQVTRPDPLVAPLTQGQAVGTLRISHGDQPVMDLPLTVLEGVEQAGVLGRAWDALRLWIR
jgi:D-alanyl-D-alanine carboxypeptidase (penicillin-binding protein 5/6)